MLVCFAMSLTAMILAYTQRKEDLQIHIITLVFVLIAIIVPGFLLFKTFCVKDDELSDFDQLVYEKEQDYFIDINDKYAPYGLNFKPVLGHWFIYLSISPSTVTTMPEITQFRVANGTKSKNDSIHS